MPEDSPTASPTDLSGFPRPLPAPSSHCGGFIRLDPQNPQQDAPDLFRISHGEPELESIWKYLPVGPFPGIPELESFLHEWGNLPDVRAFTVRSAGGSQLLGSISLMSLRPSHGVGELGNIWFCPSAQRTKANTEANFLLLRHCFDDLGYRRMEWKCNALNAPSRRAALRLGFIFEGIFRQHMIVKGENRDTAWFSILDHEWPRIKAAMEAWLAGDPAIPLSVKPRSNPARTPDVVS